MAKINWTAEAERWLKDIYDYISEDNREAAVRTIEAIYDKAQILTEFPQMATNMIKLKIGKYEFYYTDIIVLPT